MHQMSEATSLSDVVFIVMKYITYLVNFWFHRFPSIYAKYFIKSSWNIISVEQSQWMPALIEGQWFFFSNKQDFLQPELQPQEI